MFTLSAVVSSKVTVNNIHSDSICAKTYPWLVTVVHAIAIGVASGEVATEHSVLRPIA